MIMRRPMNPDRPTRYVYDFDEPPATSAEERLRLLGGKGANLVVMASRAGLARAAGLRGHDRGVSRVPGRDVAGRVWTRRCAPRWIGSGARLGGASAIAADPLLVSVRSGAPVSMPGMMDTILNLGLNDATVDGLARSAGEEFAADCLRRFREGYASVIGHRTCPQDPWQQLRAAVEAVFRSWNSDRARAYRSREGIADDLGTAVTVQAMVFGNRGETSGTGVLFTRNPSTGENVLLRRRAVQRPGRGRRRGHARARAHRDAGRRAARRSPLSCAATRRSRAAPDGCGGHRVHDRGRPAVDAPGPDRQEVAARGVAHGDRDGRRRIVPTLARRSRSTRVMPLLADPPRVFVRASDAGAPIATRSACLTRSRSRRTW